MMSPLGLAAALSHLVAHAFMKICSFFCAGAVMHQTGKTYVYELDGMGKRMPVTFGCLTVASFSLMGIPLFAGFISKWNLGQAAFRCAGDFAAVSAEPMAGGTGILGTAGRWLPYVGVAVILYSALMTGIYMLTVLVRAYFPKISAAVMPCGGEMDAEGSAAKCDPNWMMLVPLLIFVVAILLIGVHSAPLMELLTAIGGEAG